MPFGTCNLISLMRVVVYNINYTCSIRCPLQIELHSGLYKMSIIAVSYSCHQIVITTSHVHYTEWLVFSLNILIVNYHFFFDCLLVLLKGIKVWNNILVFQTCTSFPKLTPSWNYIMVARLAAMVTSVTSQEFHHNKNQSAIILYLFMS